MTYNAEKIIGNGSFGVVFKATIVETGETGGSEVGVVHGVLVLSRDLSLITIIVRNILSEVDAANGSDGVVKSEKLREEEGWTTGKLT